MERIRRWVWESAVTDQMHSVNRIFCFLIWFPALSCTHDSMNVFMTNCYLEATRCVSFAKIQRSHGGKLNISSKRNKSRTEHQWWKTSEPGQPVTHRLRHWWFKQDKNDLCIRKVCLQTRKHKKSSGVFFCCVGRKPKTTRMHFYTFCVYVTIILIIDKLFQSF